MKTLREKAIIATIIAIAIVLVLMVLDYGNAHAFDQQTCEKYWGKKGCINEPHEVAYRRLWRQFVANGKQPVLSQRTLNRQRQQSVRERAQAMEDARPLYPNGTPWSDEQLAESNKTRYNASGKQQVQRRVEGWRSPLNVYANEPGVYSSGYLGPVPNGPVGGPYCPPGYNCFKIERGRSDNERKYQTKGEAFNRSRPMTREEAFWR